MKSEVCDLCTAGNKREATHIGTFSVGGKRYRVATCGTHEPLWMRMPLADLVDVASGNYGYRTQAQRVDDATVRAWWKAHRTAVPDLAFQVRGRIPEAVHQAYAQATS